MQSDKEVMLLCNHEYVPEYGVNLHCIKCGFLLPLVLMKNMSKQDFEKIYSQSEINENKKINGIKLAKKLKNTLI